MATPGENPADKRLEFFRQQLTPETLRNLTNMDLANNPKAAEHLIGFLDAMGVNPEEMQPLLGKVAGQAHIHEALGKADLGQVGQAIGRIMSQSEEADDGRVL